MSVLGPLRGRPAFSLFTVGMAVVSVLTLVPAPETGAVNGAPSAGPHAEAFPLRRLALDHRYDMSRTVVTTFKTLTPSGVCMDARTDPPRPHPVYAANCGMNMWHNYQITNDRAWLEKAITQGAWLISFRREYGGGWFFPYLWDHRLGATPTAGAVLLRKPWYSALAQGQALGLFVRLYEATREQRWRAAADATFASLLVPAAVRRPWVTWIHNNYLWLEETTFADTPSGDRILNGHMFALFGVYDYWMLTGDARAASLARAALTTALVFATRLRRPAWRSYYDDFRRGDSADYHYIHVQQLLYLNEMTGDPRFTRAALQLWADAQPNTTEGTIVVSGTVKAYRLRAGRLVAARTFTFARSSRAPLAWRYRVEGSARTWLRPGAGFLKGLYLPEKGGSAYVRGIVAERSLRMPLVTTAARATVRFYTYDPARAVIAGATDTRLGVGAPIRVDRYAVIAGVVHYRVASGEHAGRWVGLSHITG